MKSGITWIGSLVAVLILGACSTSGSRIDPDSIEKIEPGFTTKTEVQRWFGAPNAKQLRGSGGERWRYTHQERQERSTRTLSRIGSFIAALMARWVPIAPVNLEYTNTIRHDLVVFFDSRGVVADYTYDRQETPTKSIR